MCNITAWMAKSPVFCNAGLLFVACDRGDRLSRKRSSARTLVVLGVFYLGANISLM